MLKESLSPETTLTELIERLDASLKNEKDVEVKRKLANIRHIIFELSKKNSITLGVLYEMLTDLSDSQLLIIPWKVNIGRLEILRQFLDIQSPVIPEVRSLEDLLDYFAKIIHEKSLSPQQLLVYYNAIKERTLNISPHEKSAVSGMLTSLARSKELSITPFVELDVESVCAYLNNPPHKEMFQRLMEKIND